jgi:hypothetical protein
VNRIFRFSYFDPDYATSVLTVTGLARVYWNMNARFEVLTVVVMKNSVFRDITQCNLLKMNCWLSTANSQYECCLMFKELQTKPICFLISLQHYGRVLCSQTNLVRLHLPPQPLTFVYGTLCFFYDYSTEKYWGSRFIRNVGKLIQHSVKASLPRRQ